MLKPIAVLAVSGTLGGVGLYYERGGGPAAPEPQLGAHRIEVGVAFAEAAVRAALPHGVEPAPGFTGGIAVYSDPEGNEGVPRSAGYVWLDVEASDGTARYRLKSFTSEVHEGITPAALDAATRGEVRALGGSEILHLVTWPDSVSGIELVLRPSSETCLPITKATDLIVDDMVAGDLGMAVLPVLAGWCAAEAEVAVARVTAPLGHPLRPFVPLQVLWAEIATPMHQEAPDPSSG